MGIGIRFGIAFHPFFPLDARLTIGEKGQNRLMGSICWRSNAAFNPLKTPFSNCHFKQG